MKLIHKVEECAVYESNKHSYASFSSSKENDPPIKTYLLKIAPTITESTSSPSQLLNELMVKIKHVTAHTSTSIKFKAQQVVPLKAFIEELHSSSNGMAYTLTLKLLADIGTQLERIRAERDVIVPFLSLEDIVVIVTSEPSDDKQEQQQHDKQEQHNKQEQKVFDFVFINSEKLLQTNKKAPKELVVDVPLKVNKHTSFLPIELPESALKRLPMRLTSTSWYYSLSALCIYALLQHKFKNGEDDIERIGRPFLHTSLYFCLKRCLKPDPEERVLLYV